MPSPRAWLRRPLRAHPIPGPAQSAGRRAIFKTSSSSYGYKCEDVEKADKAEHGTVNVTAEFYDKAHLS